MSHHDRSVALVTYAGFTVRVVRLACDDIECSLPCHVGIYLQDEIGQHLWGAFPEVGEAVEYAIMRMHNGGVPLEESTT